MRELISRESALKVQSIEEIRPRVAELLLSYESLLHKLGINHVKATNNNFELLNQVDSIEMLQRMVFKMNPCLEILESIAEDYEWETSRFEEMIFLKEFCRKTGLTFRGDLYELFTDGDVVEIYDLNAVQAYRSFNFFPVCSYSLEEVFIYEWYHLFRRDENITKQFQIDCMKLVNGELEMIVDMQSPVHQVEEMFSAGMGVTQIQAKSICPLKNEYGQVAALFHSFKVLSHKFTKWVPGTRELELI